MKPCKTCKEFSCGANGSDYVSMKCGSEEGFIHVAADCFSLPNAAELVDKMRDYADTAEDNIYGICVNTPNVLRQAADAIEQLITENESYRKAFLDLHIELSNLYEDNAKLKEERDAAVADLKKACYLPYGGCHLCNNTHTELCRTCIRSDMFADIADKPTDKWEWRGVKEDNR